MLKIKTEYEKVFPNIVNYTRKYLIKNKNLKSLVIGISGGIDSAVICALAFEVLKEIPNVKLIGRTIPIETNTEHEILRAKMIGKNFCHNFEVKDLTSTYQDIYSNLVTDPERMNNLSNEEKIRKGNIKARTRMIYLFDLAHYNKGMVISTDNYTELLLGFWTLHGDVGNFGMIQYLWKTEVYGLAGYLVEKYKNENNNEKADALKLCIDAVPTDGLGITTSDFDQIGVTEYETADMILIDYLKGNEAKKNHPTIERHVKSEFKRVDPINIPREVLFK